MKSKILGMFALAFVVMCMAIAPATTVLGATGDIDTDGDGYTTDIDSGWATVPPVIDGDIDNGEWSDAFVVYFDYEGYPSHLNDTIYEYFMNDADFLYIGIDICPDNTYDEDDWIELYFDEDDNDEYEPYEPDLEAMYHFHRGIFWEWFGGGGEPITLSAEPPTFPLEYDPYNITFWGWKPCLYASDFDDSINSDTDHVMWEFAIPISNFIHGELELGDTVKYGNFGYGTLPFWSYPDAVEYPNWDEEDSSAWANITFATAPVVPVETGYTAEEYGMMMIGIGFVIALILALLFKSTYQQWIEAGQWNYVYMGMGVPLLIMGLGLLQWMYDWLGMLGLS